MAVPKVEYTPVVAHKGRRVHAVALTSRTTACGRDWSFGWKIALKKVNCHLCKVAVLKGIR